MIGPRENAFPGPAVALDRPAAAHCHLVNSGVTGPNLNKLAHSVHKLLPLNIFTRQLVARTVELCFSAFFHFYEQSVRDVPTQTGEIVMDKYPIGVSLMQVLVLGNSPLFSEAKAKTESLQWGLWGHLR